MNLNNSLSLTSLVAAVFLLLAIGCGKPVTEQTAAEKTAAKQPDATASSETQSSAKQATDKQTTDVVATTPAEKTAEPKQATTAATTLVGNFPPLAPLPSMPVPADNPISDAKVALGKLLFFDDRLSGDVGTSCASCHDPRLGWGDGNALSRGYAGTQHWRNSQTTINTAYLSKLFWAGEAPSLEAQAHSAISGNLAGNGDPVMIEERLAQVPQYVEMFEEALSLIHI